MNDKYKRASELLDHLTPIELTTLLEDITNRLRKHLGELVEEEFTLTEVIEESSRRYLPRLPQLIEWGLVTPMEDTLYIRDYPNKPALLIDSNRVAYEGKTMNINDWAKHITGWKGVNIYEWIVVKDKRKTLDQLRRAHMDDSQ